MADLGIIFLRRKHTIHWYQSLFTVITGSMPFRYFWATLYRLEIHLHTSIAVPVFLKTPAVSMIIISPRFLQYNWKRKPWDNGWYFKNNSVVEIKPIYLTAGIENVIIVHPVFFFLAKVDAHIVASKHLDDLDTSLHWAKYTWYMCAQSFFMFENNWHLGDTEEVRKDASF